MGGGDAETQLSPAASGFMPAGQQVPHDVACDAAQQAPLSSMTWLASAHGVTHLSPVLLRPSGQSQLYVQLSLSLILVTWPAGQCGAHTGGGLGQLPSAFNGRPVSGQTQM